MREIEAQKRIDALAGLYNLGHLDELLVLEFDHTVRYRWTLSSIFFDFLYFFKKIDDTYGHDAGDTALQQAAQLLVKATRDTDHVAQYGREECIHILPGVAAGMAQEVGERLVAAFHNEQVQTETYACSTLTISADVATLLRAADRAMYSEKLHGRDRLMRWQLSVA